MLQSSILCSMERRSISDAAKVGAVWGVVMLIVFIYLVNHAKDDDKTGGAFFLIFGGAGLLICGGALLGMAYIGVSNMMFAKEWTALDAAGATLTAIAALSLLRKDGVLRKSVTVLITLMTNQKPLF